MLPLSPPGRSPWTFPPIAGTYVTGAWHFYDFLPGDHDRLTVKWPSALVRCAELGLC